MFGSHNNKVEPDAKSGASVQTAEETMALKTKEDVVLKYNASPIQVFFMGISIIIGGQFMDWNKGLVMGLWECFISLAIVAIGYFCLTFCLAEMTSILPFSGGSFGYVRCSLGPRVGYDVGFCESMAYMLFVSAALDSIDDIIRAAAGLSSDASFYIYVTFYALGIPFMCMGGPWIWWGSTAMAISALLLVCIYCLSNIPNDNVMYFNSNHHFQEGIVDYLQWFPLMTWFFKGIEPLTLACNNVDRPGRRLPRAMISAIVVMIFSAFFILLTTCSIPPLGPMYLSSYPHFMAYGYVMGLKVSLTDQVNMMGLLALPACIGTAYGYMYAFGQQLHSMAMSGLAPEFLKRTCGSYDAPYAAVITGSLVSLTAIYVMHVLVDDISTTLFGICMLSTCMVDVSLCIAFLVYKERYSALEHEFVNPLGRASAYIGAFIFAFIGVAIAFFRQDNYTALIFFAVIVILGALYYHFVARHTECFSKEEQEKFFKAYVLNANVMKRKGQNKRKKASTIVPAGRSQAVSGHSQSKTG